MFNGNSNNDENNNSSEQQENEGQPSINQSVFDGGFGVPVCILRTPTDLANLSRQRDTSNQDEPVETGKVIDETSEGKFGDKFSLHVKPVEGKNNLFTNRISYNTQTDAYYENGILSNKYLKEWNEGAYQWNNIESKTEYDWNKRYLARGPTDDKMYDDGEISWKFDYRTGSFIINSLKIRLSFGTFDNLASVQWFIKPLPTMKNQNPTWQLIQFDPYTEYRHQTNEIKDVTQFVKNEYGFILKAHLSGGEDSDVIWQKTQLFRQNWDRSYTEGLYVEDDETFGLDVKVELKPDIIVDDLSSLPESFVLNDETTSDFVIHFEVQTGVSNKGTKDFYVHSRVLSTSSDYFKALLDSRMIESQNKSLTLTDADVSYESLEIILNYLYTGTIPNITSYDEWITLLHYASRFLIPTLIQRCEKGLKGYLSYDNLSEVKDVASECGAEQLLQYCENFEPPRND